MTKEEGTEVQRYFLTCPKSHTAGTKARSDTQETISMLEEPSGTAQETVDSKAGSEFLSNPVL